MEKRKSAGVKVPKLGLHKASGHYRVVIDRRTVYLGKDRQEAEHRYREIITYWLATGRLIGDDEDRGLLVEDLVAAFLEAHEHYYVNADGKADR